MRVATSYFAQLRNFTRNMIPISTACYDPKWFHEDNGIQHKFLDKRGILNGLRCRDLAPGDRCNNLCHGVQYCKTKNPGSCEFLQKYWEQLDSIDPLAFRTYCSKVAKSYSEQTDIPEEDLILVFLVFEKYDQPCSERMSLLRFFRKCGFDAEELKYPIRDNYKEV